MRGHGGLPISRLDHWAPDHPIGSPFPPELLWLVNLIENAAVVEIGLLRFGPAAEEIVHGKQFDLRELLSVFLRDFRQRGADRNSWQRFPVPPASRDIQDRPSLLRAFLSDRQPCPPH